MRVMLSPAIERGEYDDEQTRVAVSYLNRVAQYVRENFETQPETLSLNSGWANGNGATLSMTFGSDVRGCFAQDLNRLTENTGSKVVAVNFDTKAVMVKQQ